MSERDTGLGQDDPSREGANAPEDIGSPPQALPGNRPATGAAQIAGTSELDTAWKGSAGATDFLGLDGEVRGASPTEPMAPSGTLEVDSWLLSIEGSADAPPPAGTFEAQESELEPSELEAAQAPEETEDPEQAPVGAPEQKPGRGRMLAAAAVVLVLAGGSLYVWKPWKAHGPVGPDIAALPPAHPKPQPKLPPKPDVHKPVTGGTPVIVESGTSTTPTPPPVTPGTTGTTGTGTPPPPTVASTDTTPTVPDTAVEPDRELMESIARYTFTNQPKPTITPDAAGSTDAPELTETGLVHRAGPKPTGLGKGDLTKPFPGGVRRANEEDYTDLWREKTIPFDAIDGPRRLRTLDVGRVRVLLANGEFFEGVLYAVGQRKVWLQIDLGRIAFEAGSVKDIAQLVSQTGVSGLVTPDAAKLSGLPRMHVRAAGGTLTGRVLDKDGDSVTLVTEEGVCLTVQSHDVVAAPQGNARILKPGVKP